MLTDERMTTGRRPFVVLRFEKAISEERRPAFCEDPIYWGIDRGAAILFGPHLIRRWEPEFVNRLHQERNYLFSLAGLGESAKQRIRAIETLLDSRNP